MPDSERFKGTEYLSKSHRVKGGRGGRRVCYVGRPPSRQPRPRSPAV